MKRTVLAFLLLVQTMIVCAASTPTYDELKQQLNDKSLPLVNITVDINRVSKPEYTNAMATPWRHSIVK